MQVDFSKCEGSLQLNGLLTSHDVHSMMEAKDYQCINMVLSFIFGCVNKATGYIEDAKLTRMNTIYFALLFKICSRSSKMKSYLKAGMSSLTCKVREVKDAMVRSLDDHCEL